MSTLYGFLGMEDRDRTVDQVGQLAVYTAVNEYMSRVINELNKLAGLFVEAETTLYSITQNLPGAGKLQKKTRLGNTGSRKSIAKYTTDLPLFEWGDSMGWDEVSLSYMTVAQLESFLMAVQEAMIETRREEILRSLFNNANESFQDEIYNKALTIKRLANTDGTLYPQQIGSNAQAERERYQVAGYAPAAFSSTNNPFRLIANEFYKDFDKGRIVAFINSAQEQAVEGLPSFVEATKMFTTAGANRDALEGTSNTPESRTSPSEPGTLVGAVNDVIVRKWDFVPTGYILAVDSLRPKPLYRRVDVPEHLRGWQMSKSISDQPLFGAEWRLREGYAVVNRLNGMVVQLDNSGSYNIPTDFA